MSFWSAGCIAREAKGRWLAAPMTEPRGASIDTRTLRPGQIFFALRGERLDGHNLLDRAGDASMAVVEREVEAPRGLGLLLVQDTRAAMADLAQAYRTSFTTTRVIGVTGSAGKTTTVRLIEAALSSRRGSASERSFNNELGVPLTILNAEPDADFLICEIGTNAPGEIDALSAIVRPDIAVITTVGRAHFAGFGSKEAIVREKTSIAAHVRRGGDVIISADAPALTNALPTAHTFGLAERADTRIVRVTQDVHGLELALADGFVAHIPLFGRHNAVNAGAAIAVARRLGVDDASIANGLAHTAPAAQRLHVEDLGPVLLIDDAYNANPESTLAALDTLAELGAAHDRRVAILGDMLELGRHAEDAHAEVARRAAEVADVRMHVGPQFAAVIVDALTDLSEERVKALADQVAPGDAVLVKASRGMRLERVCEAIRRRFAMETPARADNREVDARLPE